MTFLGDVVARARGLATHLLPGAVLEELARAPDRTSFASALEERGYRLVDTGGAEDALASVDAAIRRVEARRLAVLGRWLGPRRREGFAGVFEAADRRLLRILLRAAAAGGVPDPLPPVIAATPAHPRRSLAGLGGVRDPAELVARLARAGSPYAPSLADALRESRADLLALEAALDRAFFQRARHGARRVDRRLREWVAEEIDLHNGWDALLGGSGAFVEGGRALTAVHYDAVLGEPDTPSRLQRLAAVFSRESTGPVFSEASSPALLEARALAARTRSERRRARREPLGAAPILLFVLLLQVEVAALLRLNWGIGQGVDPEALLDPLRSAREAAA